jgi:hypothetical protein
VKAPFGGTQPDRGPNATSSSPNGLSAMARRGCPWLWPRRLAITSNTSDFDSSRGRFPKLRRLARQPFRQTRRPSRPGTNRTPQGATLCWTLHAERSHTQRSAPMVPSPLDAKAPESRKLAQPDLEPNRTFPATPPCDSIYLLLIVEGSGNSFKGKSLKNVPFDFSVVTSPFFAPQKNQKNPLRDRDPRARHLG